MQVLGKNFKTESLSTLYDSSASTPKSTQTQTQTNPNDVEQVNLAQMAGGVNGSLEIQKYLYETGLQNIFNDYNKQIASLDASKQKEIEDAYYVRELSKKYLGEYASNTGIGDVSGQLLDIYGKYQSNMNEINANFTELQTGLESSYSDKKNEYELGLLQTQMNIETAEQQEQLEKELAEINYNIALELYPEGMDAQDYLDSVRDKIGESNYWNEMAKHKIVEMSDTVKNELKNTNDYKNQGEWDTHVDSLLSTKSISKQQADYLKGMYEVEQNTNFVLDNSINVESDISYYNSDEDIISKGNVYVSRGGDTILAETKNVIDSSSEYFERIKKSYEKYDEKGKFIGDVGIGVPFGSGNQNYVATIKDKELVFVEYKISTNYNKLTDNIIISSSNESQKEMYDEIHKTLNGKDGYVQTPRGMLAYTYNSETKEYTQYLDFQASGVGSGKGNFNIGGTMYEIKKEYKNNGGKDIGVDGMVDVKHAWEKGDWKSGFKDKHNAKAIVQTMIDNYFNGDKSKFSDYIEGSRKKRSIKNKNKINNSNSIVVEYGGAYYTINNGLLWELSEKKRSK